MQAQNKHYSREEIFLSVCARQKMSGVRLIWKTRQKQPYKPALRLLSFGFPSLVGGNTGIRKIQKHIA